MSSPMGSPLRASLFATFIDEEPRIDGKGSCPEFTFNKHN
jgi:hypothetical protein